MFTPDRDQEDLRTTLREFFAERSPDVAVRSAFASENGYDPALWTQMAKELGLLGMAVPASAGGSGFSYAEACLVLEEAGRASVAAPLLSTLALTINAVLEVASPLVAERLLPPICDGSVLTAVALPGTGHSVEATPTPAGWTLDGTTSAVLDGSIAGRVLVAASGYDGPALFEVDALGDGVQRSARDGLDLTRRWATFELRAARATRICAPGALEGSLERITALATVGLACEQVGGAQRALDASVAFAKSRVQFGRAIGSFQAVKHRLADMLVAVETARSAAYEAVGAAVSGSGDELLLAAAVAGSYCSEAFSQVAEDAIQVHGGIGFTWEHSAHLWFRRAKADAVLIRTPSAHRARLAEMIS